jgi:hypothetical protein
MSPGIIALHNDSESFFCRRNRLTGIDCFLRARRGALPPRGDGRSSLAGRAQGLAPRQASPTAVVLCRPPSDELAYPDGSWSPALQLALNAAMANSLFRKRNEHRLGLKPLTSSLGGLGLRVRCFATEAPQYVQRLGSQGCAG